MALPTNDVTKAAQDAIVAGAGTGIGAALIGLFAGWGVMKKRSARTHTRLQSIEAQIERDKAFRKVVIESQLSQIDMVQLILDRQVFACEDCPNAHNPKLDERTQKSIDTTKAKLQSYLGSLA